MRSMRRTLLHVFIDCAKAFIDFLINSDTQGVYLGESY